MPTKDQLREMAEAIYGQPYVNLQPDVKVTVMRLAIAAKQASALQYLSGRTFA